MANSKFYVVWQGRKTGVFNTWAECKAQVDGFKGAKHKSFPTHEEALNAFKKMKAPKKKSIYSKNKSKTVNSIKKYLSNEDIFEHPYEIKIFTDGACEPNPGPSGSGLAIYKDNVLSELQYGLFDIQGTNNTAELKALQAALYQAETFIKENKTVGIYADSDYSIKCISKWANSWQKNGWKTSSGGEIANLDLIKSMLDTYSAIKDKLNLHHVKGHSGIEGNELADRMALYAIETNEIELGIYDDHSIPDILAMYQ